MRTTKFTSGEWNAICDVCGFKMKASTLQERWDGLMVCSKDWETRHPQELIRPIPDQQKLPWTRPESTDVYLNASCTVVNRQGVPDLGAPDCAVPDLDLGYRDTLTITSS